jgi:hypothetical protein
VFRPNFGDGSLSDFFTGIVTLRTERCGIFPHGGHGETDGTKFSGLSSDAGFSSE